MTPKIATLSHEIALQDWGGPGAVEAQSDARLAAIIAAGTELWLDTGDLDAARRLWRSEFSGLTTNNTLVNQVIQTGALDDVIRAAAERLRSAEGSVERHELVMEVGFIANCRVALALIATFGVRVSVELHPSLAHQVDESVLFGRRYHSVCPDYFLIKVPLTPAGYCAAARLESEGVAVNFTLGFSARQNYLAALLARPRFVNVFLGRLNAVVGDNGLGDGRDIGEKVTLASARAVRQARDARPAAATRQIAASMRAPSQMADLAGVDVQTVPPKVAEEFLAGGASPEGIRSQLERDPEILLNDGVNAEDIGLDVLWEVDEATRATADDLLRANLLKLTPEDLVRASDDHGARLFHRFTRDEEAAVAAKGKIPELSRWRGRVALDDLMTRSGLLSFTADQQKLDDRIRSLIG
ncbi:MAG: transaldolase family protein [Armatimonadota bacterium]|nr:MAG: transaldolase family protein [Armatimonadota bacterium]